jgi:hypothetical protein
VPILGYYAAGRLYFVDNRVTQLAIVESRLAFFSDYLQSLGQLRSLHYAVGLVQLVIDAIRERLSQRLRVEYLGLAKFQHFCLRGWQLKAIIAP